MTYKFKLFYGHIWNRIKGPRWIQKYLCLSKTLHRGVVDKAVISHRIAMVMVKTEVRSKVVRVRVEAMLLMISSQIISLRKNGKKQMVMKEYSEKTLEKQKMLSQNTTIRILRWKHCKCIISLNPWESGVKVISTQIIILSVSIKWLECFLIWLLTVFVTLESLLELSSFSFLSWK